MIELRKNIGKHLGISHGQEWMITKGDVYICLPSGNQTWQRTNPFKWKFLAGKIIYKWRIFKPRLITGSKH